MKTCQYHTIDPEEPCDNLCEGSTDFCGSHNARIRKSVKSKQKEEAKRKEILGQKREPRATPTRDPKKWKNTFLCSDGTRVTQAEINERRAQAYAEYDAIQDPAVCEGCGKSDSIDTAHAHIIAQARCKAIGKTQLIWTIGNFFHGCSTCNDAIYTPNNPAWKKLENLDDCMNFIQQHDKTLFQKFLNNGYQAKIKTGETI